MLSACDSISFTLFFILSVAEISSSFSKLSIRTLDSVLAFRSSIIFFTFSEVLVLIVSLLADTSPCSNLSSISFICLSIRLVYKGSLPCFCLINPCFSLNKSNSSGVADSGETFIASIRSEAYSKALSYCSFSCFHFAFLSGVLALSILN